MTSETSSVADSPGLLHRPLLTAYSDGSCCVSGAARLVRGHPSKSRQSGHRPYGGGGGGVDLRLPPASSPPPTSPSSRSPTSPGLSRFSPPCVRFHPLDMDHKTARSGGAGGRLAAPRMSLLGRPVNYRATRRDARYRRIQSRVYNFLERPRGVYAVSYHMLVFCMVFTCLVLSVFSTIDEYEKEAGVLLFYMEMIVVVWFTAEFLFRLWSSGCRSRYQTAMGRLKFLRRPFCIIDVITIIASIVVLAMRSSGQVFAASALRGLRFFQILRMVRMDRRGGTWKLLGSVVYAHRQELITTLYIGFLGLIFASFLVYLAEKEDEHFNNFAKALWWGVITLCTVGYGDAVPKTWQGKVIASFCALLGISFFALPAGILGSGFALKVQQQQRQKHMIRRRQPAATLIQALWRCYAADEHSMSIATWKIHQVPLPSPPSSRPSSSFKHNASFVSRLPTIRRHKSTSLHSPSLHKLAHPGYHSQRSNASGRFTDFISSSENLGGQPTSHDNNGHNNEPASGGTITSSRQLNASYSEDSVTETALSKRNSDDEDEEPRCIQLTNQHKGAIRAIRKLKYFVARKKFREALKPYDVKDVIEQYSSGHADLLNRVRNLHFRLDQILGKQGSKARDVYASKLSLASRIVKVERQVDDIEIKLDQLIELYMEDRKHLLALPMSEILERGTGPSGPPPPSSSSSSHQQQPPDTPLSAELSAGCGFVLKPILVDKQLSEPSSPTTGSFREAGADRPGQQGKPRQMHRGHSDLGSRVKKRVTLSSIPSQLVLPGEPSKLPRFTTTTTPETTSTSTTSATEAAVTSAMTTSSQGDVVITVPPLCISTASSGLGDIAEQRVSVCYSSTVNVNDEPPHTPVGSTSDRRDDPDGAYKRVGSEDEEEDEEDEEGEEDADDDDEEDGREADYDEDEEEEETLCENTALLGSVRTQIIITPSLSPVQSSYDLNLDHQSSTSTSRVLDFDHQHSRS